MPMYEITGGPTVKQIQGGESRQAMRQALLLVGQDRLDEGSQQLNAALELDPSNSYLQQAREFITAGHPHRSEALNVRGATPRTERA